MDLHITPLPAKYEFTGGRKSGKPFFASATREGLYNTIAKELGETGDVPVTTEEAAGDEFSTAGEGYKLVIDDEGVKIYAATPQGHFYGALTLVKMIGQFGNDLPHIVVWDKPSVAFRVGAAETLHGMRYNKKWFERWIRKLAFAGANHIYIGYEFLAFLPEMEQYSYGQFDAGYARDLAKYAAGYNVTVIPGLSVQGHYNEILALQNYIDMREVMEEEETALTDVGCAICPNKPQALEFVRRIIDILVDIFHPDVFMIGGDEIYSAGGDAECRDQMKGLGKTGIILANFIRFRDYLETKGVMTGIWGDMIISISGENRYDGVIESDKFRQSNLFLLDKLKRNTLIFDWWYTGESESSQKFFAEHDFKVIACTSTHACMMHFASPQQQINMWALFKGIGKYGLYGGMVTDWINMFGYQTEQTLFNQTAGLTMLWRGCDENFILGVTRERFETDFFSSEFKAKDGSLREYFHLAGDLYGELLSIFSPKHRGVALRKVFFYEDDPLRFFLKFDIDLKDRIDSYGKAVTRLEELWEKAKAACTTDEYFECLHMPALLNRYLYTEYTTMRAMYAHYDAAAKAQFTDKETFRAELDKAKRVLSGLSGKTAPLYEFVKYLREKTGIYDMSEKRIEGREKNILRLGEYLEHLKEDKYPMIVLKLVSEYLFRTPEDDWWKERFYDIGENGGKFSVYDVDRGVSYETMDWGYPLNK